MLVFAPDPAVLRQPPVAVVLFDTSYTRGLADGNYLAGVPGGHVHVPVRGLRLRHGRHVRRGDGRRQPPGAARRPRRDLAVAASSARCSCWPSPSRSRTSARRSTSAQNFGFPIADTLTQNLTFVIFDGFTFGQLYLVVILIAVFVCTLAIQGATVRLMFSMGRDRRAAAGRRLGPCQPDASRRRPTPAIAVGVLAAIPFLVTGAGGAAVAGHRGHRPDLPGLLPVQPRRALRPAARLAAPAAPGSSSGAAARSSTSSPSSGAA